MRWFFLTFMLLSAVAGNAILFDPGSWLKVMGCIAFNLGVLSLLIMWWSSYFRAGYAKASGLVIGHALLMLAMGIGAATLGANTVVTNSCEGLIADSNSRNFLSQLAAYVNSTGYCRELGVGWILLGLLLAYPSVRLFIGLCSSSDHRNTIR